VDTQTIRAGGNLVLTHFHLDDPSELGLISAYDFAILSVSLYYKYRPGITIIISSSSNIYSVMHVSIFNVLFVQAGH